MDIEEKKKEVVSFVRDRVGEFFNQFPGSSTYKFPLISRLYDQEEVAEVLETLLSPERLTLNAKAELKIEKFENLWSDYIGVKNGIMVNSGSSANLVAYYALSNPTIRRPIKAGDEVITTALTWGTSVTPLYALGMKPVFIDVNLSDYTMNVDLIESAITNKTRAIMVVHLLGFPCNMDKIMEIARKHDLFVIEDCCEAHGAEWKGNRVGSFGDLSTFSFYLSHHITTIEGGMVLTNSNNYAELARIIRSQGVMRNVKDEEYKNSINSQAPEIDPRFLFANTGYNFRPTEMEGSFGIVQFKRFEGFYAAREFNAKFITEMLREFPEYFVTPELKNESRAAWFSYPIQVKDGAPFTKKELVEFLEKEGIETRPIMSGNFTKHPVAKIYEFEIVGDLDNTNRIHDNAFLIGSHAGIKEEHLNLLKNKFYEFLEEYK